jgi:transcriptional regulator with XRE-family HTH domain
MNTPQISDAALALFQQARKLNKSDLDRLAEAADRLDEDPKFRAEYLKSLLVEQIREAMDDKGISQSDLARLWGKTRQYLSRVLNEDKRVNFTLETLVELSSLVGRKVEVNLLDPSENTHVLRCKVAPRTVAAQRDFGHLPAVRRLALFDAAEFVDRGTNEWEESAYESARVPA